MAIDDQSEIQKLATEFAVCTIGQTEEIRNGNPRKGNQYAKRYVSAFKKLRTLGDCGRDGLIPLLNHSRADVRAMAAAFLLRYKTEKALETLRKESSGTGLVAFGAQQAMKRWEEGTWNLDPP